jgi:hypothetical protein
MTKDTAPYVEGKKKDTNHGAHDAAHTCGAASGATTCYRMCSVLVPEHPCSLDHCRFQAVLASVCLAPSCASAATSRAAVPAALTFATRGASQTRACSARASTQFGPLRSLPLLICANGARHQQLQRLLALHLCAHLLKTCDFRILHLCIVASSATPPRRRRKEGCCNNLVAATWLVASETETTAKNFLELWVGP